MIKRYNPAAQPFEAGVNREWRDSETLFLLTCYDVWSATPPRRCAALFDNAGTV